MKKHIMVDSYGCNSNRLDSLMDIYELIQNLVDNFGLEAIMPPQLTPYYFDKKIENGGISAYVLLKGGHISIHTFPELECYFFDMLYDCDSYIDSENVEYFLKNEFPCTKFHIKSIDRDEFDETDVAKYQGNDGFDSFGPHYFIECTKDKDPTMDELFKLLDTLPARIGMHAINRPCVLTDKVSNPNWLSGIVIIAESHIAFHYNYRNKHFLMDIFSCNEINEGKYAKMLEDIFSADVKSVLIKRGKRHKGRSAQQRINASKNKRWQKVIK